MLFFPLFFNGILMLSWGVNYSQMANYRFLIDSIIVWMISGTSKILSKPGPVGLPIATNVLQKIQEKYGNIIEKYEFRISENLKISKFLQVLCAGLFIFFEISKFEDLKI